MIFNSSGLMRCVCKVNKSLMHRKKQIYIDYYTLLYLQALSNCIYLHEWTKKVLITVLVL